MIDNTNKNVTPYSYNIYRSDWTTLDAFYGPWNSFKELVDKITKKDYSENVVDNFLKTEIPAGLTVALYENDKVVEYWNPVEGGDFVKKSSTINVSSYEEALTYVTNEENVGKIIVIPENNIDSDDESGVYIISENGELIKLGEDNSEAIKEIKDIIKENEETTSAALNDLNERINQTENTIEENEEVVAAALNDLNKRIANTSHPIEGIADNSKDLLNIDDNSKLEAKINDLFDIADMLDDDSDYDYEDFNFGLCGAGNVYEYIKSIKNELMTMITAKKTGYFKSGPTITGTAEITETLSVTSNPVTGGDVTYNWYASDTEDGEGILIGTGNTYKLTPNEYNKYIYVFGSFEENSEYKGDSKKSNVVGAVAKKTIKFAFKQSEYNVEYGKTLVVSTNRQTTADNSSLKYKVVEDEDGVIYKINMANGSVTLNTNYKLGKAKINATISGSNTYNYVPTTAEATINVIAKTVYYYGLCDADIENNYISNGNITLPNGYLSTSEKIFSLTPSTGNSDYYDTFNSWYIIVPKDTNIEIKEGTSIVTDRFKREDVIYTDEYGRVYDVYMDVTPLSALQGSWTLNITIK